MERLSSDEVDQLWEQYRSGCNPAGMEPLDRLYRALRRPLIAFCGTKGCDSDLADEISDHAFIRLMIRKPRARRGFISLMRKTAQNLLFDARRRRPSSPIPPAMMIPDDPAVDAEQAEAVKAVRACLSKLAPEDRLYIAYIDIHGLTQRAACELLGWRIAASTAHKRSAAHPGPSTTLSGRKKVL